MTCIFVEKKEKKKKKKIQCVPDCISIVHRWYILYLWDHKRQMFISSYSCSFCPSSTYAMWRLSQGIGIIVIVIIIIIINKKRRSLVRWGVEGIWSKIGVWRKSQSPFTCVPPPARNTCFRWTRIRCLFFCLFGVAMYVCMYVCM